MSHLNSGLLLAYNSLTDKHLSGYFSNTRIRRHLLRAGLITRSGRIVPDKEYRHRLLQRAHQKHVRECLAQAIFHKVLEMERLHRTEIKKKLEEFARRERVQKIKVQRSKRCEEEVIGVLSPHPPTGARGPRRNDSGPEGERSESSLSPSSSRPNTAPGKMQRPVRLKPIHSSSTTASVRRSSPYKLHQTHASSQPLSRTINESCRTPATKEPSCGLSPSYLPVINNYVTPIPPVTKRKDRSSQISPSVRGRRLRNAAASSGAEDLPWLRSSVHQSRVGVNMVYFGKTVHLSPDLLDLRDEVKVFQQHCGGENLCVFKGTLREGESFQFLSRRHRGFPFSLTFFLNGLLVERLSACCEFKYRKGSRLGGKHGHFGFLGVEGASPCYKCIIALGLDKKPTPPPKRLKEEKGPEELAMSPKGSTEEQVEGDGGGAASRSDHGTNRAENMENPDPTSLEDDKTRDDYEDDFEADDEAAAEETKEDASPPPSAQTQGKEKEASETEEEKDEDSRSDSSFSDSDREDSDVEDTKDFKEEEKRPKEKDVTPEEEEEENQPKEEEERAASPVEEEKEEEQEQTPEDSAAVKEGNSAADSTDISEPNVPSGDERKPSEETMEESHGEEEQDRAKSVQEKLAEAILKQSQCSSEPELSDSSTEEEEEHRDEGSEQPSKEENPENIEEIVTEETDRDEGGPAEVSEEHKEIPEIEEEEEEPHDETKEEKICEDEEGPEAEAEEESEAPPPAAPDDQTTDSAEEDADVAQNDEEKEEAAVETEQRPKSAEEDESSAEQPDEAAVLDDVEAADATTEMKAEPSAEQEALSCEEAPEAVTEGGADGEEGAEVTADGSSNQPQEDGDAAAPVTVEDGEEGGGSGGHASGAEADHSQRENDEEMEKTEELKPEQEKQPDSEEVVEDENTEEREKSDRKEMSNDESTVDQTTENTAEDSGNAEAGVDVEDEKTQEEEAESEETIEEPEKTRTNEESDEEKKNLTGETEDKGSSANLAAAKDDGAENTEKDGGEDTLKETEECEEERDEAERREETSEVIEEPELEENKPDEELVQKSSEIDAGSEEVPAEEEETVRKTEAENVQKGEIDAENHQKEDEKEETDAEHVQKGEIDAENVQQREIGAENTQKEEEKEETDPENVHKGAEEGEIGAENVQNGGIDVKNLHKEDEKEEIDTENVTKEDIGAENDHIEDEKEEIDTENLHKEDEKEETDAENVTKEDIDAENDHIEDEKEEIDTVNAEKVDKTEEIDAENAEKVDKTEEIDAENGEISLGDEIKSPEAKENILTSHEKDMKSESPEEEGKTEEPTEGGDPEKKKDVVVQETCTVVIETSENEGDDSLIIHDEFTKRSSEASGGDPEEHLDESKACEEAEQIKEGDQPHADQENTKSDLIENNDDKNFTETDDGNGENPQVLDDDAPADGADTEEVSKASEEGASVLLKPQTHHGEAGEAAPRGAAEAPEVFAREDNTDLVTSWINTHQTSQFFQKFVEPLEDLTDAVEREKPASPDLLRSQSPLKMEGRSEEEERQQVFRDEHQLLENDSDETARQVEEKTEAKSSTPQTEQDDTQEIKPEESPAEEEAGPAGGQNQEPRSTSGSHRSVSGKSEKLSPEKAAGPDSSAGRATPEAPSEGGANPRTEESWEHAYSRQVTQITDFTASECADGSREESQGEDVQGKESLLINQHSLHAEKLSSFSVDETLFSHTSYPLLTTEL